jgi:signal transduction histidine kinase
VHWMRHDRDQQAWIYTTCGLVSISDEDLLAWTNDSSRRVSIKRYLDNTEGVENDGVGGWYTPLTQMDREGRIWFAMRTGLGVLDPRRLNRNALPPPVHIEGLTVDNRETGISKSVSIPAKPGSLHIAYTALSFVAPRKNLYRYKLVGLDKDWSLPVSLREASYTNLHPGSYSFRVIACNNDGVWNSVGATLDFVVLPAWSQTLWFRCIAVLAVLGILTALYLIRIRFMERQIHLRFSDRMAERMRISRELHDTLLQALQGLVLSFSNFATQVSASSDVRKEMDRSLDRADRLMISGRDRIRYLRGEVQDTNGLAIEIQSILDDLFADSPSRAILSVEDSVQPLNAVIQDEILYIVKEAFTNASRHSGADEIRGKISVEKNDLHISIRDNGRGAEEDVLLVRRAGHFGIVGMRERAKAIGGRFSITSKPGEGTFVDIFVPIRIAYNDKRSWIWKLLFSDSLKP